ncbi:saccharopine dehydrogenase family protein [Calothrix rhizosoleniae]|uniref:saccharopine dehydrogenase family protein n=1 Tax=Calothrix rhizosoleniae TaxID=888997 RepID=UPI000B4A242D|nr:saccharopine dehydrogenase NADP-binding domain-containing protein [Calothrix rhizosoleniae]
MKDKVLILGGRGRIGGSVARDIATHTQAEIIVTGRTPYQQIDNDSIQYLALDLADTEKLRQAIASAHLVIHCAGPFDYRSTDVLQFCIQQGVNYIDVCDQRSYISKALKYDQQAVDAGVTAIISTGVFPGISNSMARQCIEKFDTAETLHLSYVVAGSGGAGVTVMRTTFLGLQNSFTAWIDGKWQLIEPYTVRENITFPAPYGQCGVYWYDVPETFTLPLVFPNLKSVITKFGSVPDIYNRLTWITANIFPKSWIRNPQGIEFLSYISHLMTDITDKFSGIGIAMRVEVTGIKDGQQGIYSSNLVHENTAIAAGCGTGSVAQLILEGKLKKPGVAPVEASLTTDLFGQTMESRGITLQQEWH